MTTIQCDVKGFEDVKVTFPFPDEKNDGRWRVSHNLAFWKAYAYDQPDKVNNQVGLFYGSLAVCKLEGIPKEYLVEEGGTGTLEADEFPLELFMWVVDTVYHNGLEKKLLPSKNSSGQ